MAAVTPLGPRDPEESITQLLSLWQQERRTAHERFVAEREAIPLHERVRRGVALRDLQIDERAAAPGGRTLLWLTSRSVTDLRDVRVGPGDPVRLWWDDPDGPDVVLGTVSRAGVRLGVMIDRDAQEALLDRLDDGGFRLDRDESQATFDRGDRALRRLLGAKPRSREERWRDLLFGQPPVRPGAPAPLEVLDSGLNQVQRDTIAWALAAPDLALIHGPPGTGKTRTLVEVIRQAVARGARVLATAASNTAVDNLAERLADAGVRVVRLGHPARVSAAMEPLTLDALLEATDEHALSRRWQQEAAALRRRAAQRRGRGTISFDERREVLREARALENDARRQLSGVQEAILDRAQVLCATCAGADAQLLADRTFDLVALDEATQVPDPIALVALLRGDRAVLAGDPRQLPPTILDVAAARAGLGTTFFERLPTERRRMLVVQYRMPAVLMEFPSASMYGGALVAADEVAGLRLADLPGVTSLGEGPLCFLDTAGTGWDEARGTDDPSTQNPGHAARVAEEVRRILSHGVAPADVAVIAPYDAQVRLLREALGPERDAGMEIGSVDGFQGRERLVVVVDLVRSNDQGELGFLGDTRRMNVALTRAQRHLLVVGDSATLGHHPYYAAFLQTVERVGSWRSAWEEPPA